MTTTSTPDPSLFSCDERLGAYTIEIEVRGAVTISITATDEEDARRQAQAEADRIEAEGYAKIDDPETIEVRRVRKDPVMYRVTRDGQKMQTSRLLPGDEPRQPDEYGF